MSDIDQNVDPGLDLGLDPRLQDFRSTFMDEVEVVVEDGSQTGPTAEEIAKLKKDLEDSQRQIQDLKTQADSGRAIQEGLRGLAGELRQQAPSPQPVIPQQAPGESEEDFTKRLNEGLLERGVVGTMDEYLAKKLRPEVQRLLQSNVVNSRRFVQMDPNRGPVYQRYKEEIEREVAALPPAERLYNPEVYEKITDAVSFRHADDLVEEKVKKLMETERAKLLEELKKSQPGPSAAAPVVHAEIGQQPGLAPRKREIRLTPEQIADAHAKMIPLNVYADYIARKGGRK